MGYETKLYVVQPHNLNCNPKTGINLASIDLCKCGDGKVDKLIQNAIREAKTAPIPFAVWPSTPDRQREAVDVLRAFAEEAVGEAGDKLDKLSNDIEDGYITKDKYGDPLGVIPITDMIEALKADYKAEKYRRFKWALNLLTAIQADMPDALVITYGH